MNNWDSYKRRQCNLNKACFNEDVVKLMEQHHNQLKDELVHFPEDWDVFNDTFIKMTYKYKLDGDFVSQFRILFKQLKGAYYRDDKANHFYTLEEDRISIPDFIKDEENVPDKDVDLITKLKAICHI